jgi:3-hydroxybutyrate dehydrogenase
MTIPPEQSHALITGGGTGIGLAVARALADKGHAVTIMGRSRGPLEAAAASLPGSGFAVCDVTDVASISAALAQGSRTRPGACVGQ